MYQDLTHVALNIINRCQQRCVFCFEGKRENKSKLLYDEVKSLINDAYRKKIPRIVFMGGEALLRKDIFDIIAYAKSLGFLIDLFTNGQLLENPGIVENCSKYGLTLHFSINFYNPESFVQVTRTKSAKWDSLMKALDNLDNCLIKADPAKFQVIINAVVTTYISGHLMELMNLIRSRMPHWKPFFSFKQICRFPCEDDFHHSIKLRVPFENLRREFLRIFNSGVDFSLTFQGFPLCVIPQMEHLSVDLKQTVQNYRILFNFTDQMHIEDMMISIPAAFNDTYKDICSRCSLFIICPGTFTRWQWPYFEPSPDDLPIPSSADPSEILLRFKLSESQIREIFTHINSFLLNESLKQSRLFRVVSEIFKDNLNIHGYHVVNINEHKPKNQSDLPRPGEQIELCLRKDNEYLILLLTHKVPEQEYFCSSERFGLRHSKETPLNSYDKMELAKLILEHLELLWDQAGRC
jgi:uncharacterized Fe-S cluster-containing radical SAM superfamily protein